MIDDEPDYLDMSWLEPNEFHGNQPVVITCPACGQDTGSTLYIACSSSEELDPIDLSAVTDKQFSDLVGAGCFESPLYCEKCFAWIEINTCLRIVMIEPSCTIMSWIDERNVPLAATFQGRWPRAWSPPTIEGGLGIDCQMVLESLHRAGDTRLKDLLTRCESHGKYIWIRASAQNWYAERVDRQWPADRPWPADTKYESFEDSLAAVCPSPPSIELVVAAVERARKGNP